MTDKKLPENFSKQELKEMFKETLKEWLDDKFVQFGKWSFFTLAAAGIGALLYFIFWVEVFARK